MTVLAVMPTSFGRLAVEAAACFGNRIALRFAACSWSFAELADEAARAARALIAAGIAPGDRVAIWTGNRPEWVFAALGVFEIGAVLVPVNNRFQIDEAAFCVAHSKSKILFVSEGEDVEGFPASARIVAMDAWDVFIEGGKVIDDALRRGRIVERGPDDPALVMYTSGTTGRPKGVVHANRVVRNARDCADRLGIGPDDVLLNVLPLFHCFSFNHMLVMSLVTGATQVLMERFTAAEALDTADRCGATFVAGFDTHFRDMLREVEERGARPATLRLGLMPAGLDSSTDIARAAQDLVCPTVSAYGLTEGWAGPTITPLDGTIEQRCEASGTPLPGYEYRIVDNETGAVLPPGAVGEIQQHGYSTMLGYLDDPVATKVVITDDGWLRTGDMGVIRGDGHLRFMGRYKDILKVGGENVAPAEVEAVIATHPAVREVAVVGKYHDRLVEVPVAFVVVRVGAAVTPDEITRYCDERLAKYKVPRTVLFIDALPMTSSGKVQKHVLRSRLANE